MENVGNIEASAIREFLDNLVETDRPRAHRLRSDSILDEIHLLGLEPGRPVMVAMPNGGQFIAVVLALLAEGVVPILLPPAAPASRIARMARALGADALIAPTIPPELRDSESPHRTGQTAQLAFLHGVDTCGYQPGEIILLTSGTSGVFSGCLHRIDSLLLNATRHARVIGQTGADSVLINLPMHYSYAFVAQMLATLVSGGKAVISGPPFTPARYERTIRDHMVTVSSVTPVMVASWCQARRELPAPLRVLTVGGAALDTALVADLVRRNPDLALYLTYGLTEAGPRVSTLAAHLEPPERYSSVGLPLPGVHVDLRRPEPDDEVGELIIGTDTGMLRRVGRRDAPASSTTDTTISTGDMFSMDDEGYLYFQGRQPYSVLIGGEKVCLKSVCAIAETLPGILGAQAWTQETPAGDIVFTLDLYCDDTTQVDEREIRRQLAKILLRSEQPTSVQIHPASHLGWRKSRLQGSEV